MHTRVTVLTLCVCLCVCSKFAAFKSSLYDKMNLPACFSPDFLDFRFIDLSKMPSFPRKSVFHGYFVVHINGSVYYLWFSSHVALYIEHTRVQVMTFLDDRSMALT